MILGVQPHGAGNQLPGCVAVKSMSERAQVQTHTCTHGSLDVARAGVCGALGGWRPQIRVWTQVQAQSRQSVTQSERVSLCRVAEAPVPGTMPWAGLASLG